MLDSTDTKTTRASFRSVAKDQEQREHMLDAETEQRLARAWKEHQDEDALHHLINAYDPLAMVYANKFSKSIPHLKPDIEQEARVSLLNAAQKFDPDRGIRFSTYAVFWIKASVTDFKRKSKTSVKAGTTSAQKRAISYYVQSERKLLQQNQNLSGYALLEEIAKDLRITMDEVISAQRALFGDASLNTIISPDGEGAMEWIDRLEDDNAVNPEEQVSAKNEFNVRSEALNEALDALADREKDILIQRRLQDKATTLEALAQKYDLSRERIRQIEVAAFKKVQKQMRGSRPDLFRAP